MIIFLDFLAKATKCNEATCTIENDCRCPDQATPRNLDKSDTPKIVIFSMDDGMTENRYNVINEVLDGRINPNGCPVSATFFISTDQSKSLFYPKKMFDKGNY